MRLAKGAAVLLLSLIGVASGSSVLRTRRTTDRCQMTMAAVAYATRAPAGVARRPGAPAGGGPAVRQV
jgi:hypothetical protein